MMARHVHVHVHRTWDNAAFESKHPRADDGKFGHGSKPVLHDVVASLRQFAQKSTGSLRERIVVLNKVTNETLADVRQELELMPGSFSHQAMAHSEFTNADMFDKDGNMHPDNSILHLHTHPIDQSFSDGDWRVFARSTIDEMRVVSPNTEFSLRKTPAFNKMSWKKRTPAAMKEKWDQFEDEAFQQIIKDTPDLQGDAFVDAVIHGTNERLAKHFKVDYSSRSLRE